MNRIIDAYLTLRGILKYKTFLETSDFYEEEDMLKYQGVNLKSILLHARQEIPFYKKKLKHLVDDENLDPFEVLKKLPILSKQEVLDNRDEFIWKKCISKSIEFSTSGTTGQPLKVVTSRNQWIIEQGVIWRSWKRAGYKLFDKIAIFRSYSPKKGELKLRKDRLRNWTYFSVFDMSDEDMQCYFSYLEKWKPKFIRGYPSSLLLVAEYAIKNEIKIDSLKGAFSASEYVPNDLRDKLYQAFGILLYDHYGQAEITCMFHDCELGNLHIDREYGFVELLPTTEENLHKIIATNLHNFSMPLLRYDTGDLSDGNFFPCSCGRGMAIKKIHGRKDDFVYKSDKTKIPSVNLYTYFSKLENIKRFQIIQNKNLNIDILLDLYNQSFKNDIANEVVKELSFKTGNKISVLYDVKFIQSSEGKLPSFIQKI